MSKHIEGPWEVEGVKVKCRIFVPTSPDHPRITLWEPPAVGGMISQEQLMATALLIAAAPKMAQALQRAAMILAQVHDELHPVTQALLRPLRQEIVDAVKEATPDHYGQPIPKE